MNMQNLQTMAQQALQQAKIEMLLKGMTDTCFKRCVEKPKSSFRSSDKKCVRNCVGMYTQGMGVIEQSLIQAAESEMYDTTEGTIAYEGDEDTSTLMFGGRDTDASVDFDYDG